MAGYRTRARALRDQVFAGPVHQTVTEVDGVVGRELQALIPEIRRILGDQGDAADEIAEITGRSLARLSSEIADLHTDMAALRAETAGVRNEVAALRAEAARLRAPLVDQAGPLSPPRATEDAAQLDRS
jgi:hypothetical protein